MIYEQFLCQEVPVSESEIISALKTLQTEKPPGNDGYTKDLYKCFPHDLSPLFTLLFNDIIINQSSHCLFVF